MSFSVPYLFISAFDDIGGVGHKADLDQEAGLEPAAISVEFSSRNDGTFAPAEERGNPADA